MTSSQDRSAPNGSRRQFGQSMALTAMGLALPTHLLAQTAATAPAPRRGGTLTYVVHPEPTTLVALAAEGASTRVSGKVNEGLLTYDFNFNPKPLLATSWTVSGDGLRYTFNLRRGVKWHDGKPFTSADVAYSIRLLKEIHPRGRSTFASVQEVLTPDENTAVIVLSKPVAYLLTALAGCESPIVPRHVYEGTNWATNPNGKAPIGTGPFRFKEWVQGSHIIYERNPDYWQESRPYVDRLVVRFIPDVAARTIAFQSGEVDLVAEMAVPISEVNRLKTLPNTGIETRGFDYHFLGVHRIEFNLENEYFKHLKVRQAVAHAHDRKVIEKIVFYGYGVPADSPISPLFKRFYEPDVPKYPFDLKKAEALLDEAGFPRKAGGTRFKVVHDPIPSGEAYARMGDYTRQTLARIGIDVTIRQQDNPTWGKRIYTDRDFAFANNSMTNTFDPTVGVQRLYWSKNFKRGVYASNGSGYSNPVVDDLLERAAVEIDEKKRYALFSEFQKIVSHDLPAINLISQQWLTLYNRKRVFNHTLGPEGLLANFADVYVVQA